MGNTIAIQLLEICAQSDMRLWEKNTDKCKGNLKFRWANSSAGRILKSFQKNPWLATKVITDTFFYIQGALKLFYRRFP